MPHGDLLGPPAMSLGARPSPQSEPASGFDSRRFPASFPGEFHGVVKKIPRSKDSGLDLDTWFATHRLRVYEEMDKIPVGLEAAEGRC